MNTPDWFKKSIKQIIKKERELKQKVLEEERKYKEMVRKHLLEEKRMKDKKIALSSTIFEWKNKFLKTKEGRILLKRNPRLEVYSGGWGHEIPRYGSFGCWSRIYINQKNIEYEAGYKWMGMETRIFSKPEEMASVLDFKYLKAFVERIKTKKIYKDIIAYNS
ncbi:MAG: hypothetical protein QXU20_03290 [Candidatus Woesearchaeota archaeon]